MTNDGAFVGKMLAVILDEMLGAFDHPLLNFGKLSNVFESKYWMKCWMRLTKASNLGA